jgi:putative hydroxymethylpyrimidine transport system permease protein
MNGRAGTWILPAGFLLLIVLAWEAAVQWCDMPRYIIPAPSAILTVTVNRFGLLMGHAMVTLAEVLLGFVLAGAVSALLAVAITFSRTVERTLMPLIIASQTIPVFALAPLLILWFGYGMGSKVVMAAVIVFFPIVINAVNGLRSVDPDLVDLMKILEATDWQIFIKVKIPASLPFVFAGLKIGVAVSVIGAVIGEWVGSREGLGYLMIHANAQLKTELVFACILMLSLMGIFLYALVSRAGRVIAPWQLEQNKTN